jgi:hypothetical protein
MFTFRHRPDKIKYLNTIKTLDETNKKHVMNFITIKEKIPELHNQLQEYENELEILETTQLYSDDGIKRRAFLKENIELVRNNIELIDNDTHELEYYSKTNDILINYYDIVNNNENDNINNTKENINNDKLELIEINDKELFKIEPSFVSNKLDELNNISQQKRKPKKITKKRPRKNANIASRSIIDFLSKPSDKVSFSKKKEEDNVNLHKNRAELLNNYMALIDSDYGEKKKSKITKICNICSIEKILIRSEGIFVCKNCGDAEYVIIESDIPNYKECGTEKPCYPYKRLNHFIEWLNQFQARESTEIPKHAYDIILDDIRKNRLNIKKITFTKMKQILKKLKLHQYYEHTSHILSTITGCPPPILCREMEDKMITMFKEIQEPFAKYCPKERVNFLSYSYVLHKFSQILGLTQFLENFPLLKSRDKLRLQDEIWKGICRDLHWNFEASI